MRKLSNKTGAMELSISTIVIIVIALTMLILGIVLVRSIMCSAIQLTSDTSNAAGKEVNKLFEANGGEVQCIGGESNLPTLIPGKTSVITCGVRAKATAKYSFTIDSIEPGDKSILTVAEIKSWISGSQDYSSTVVPGDEDAKKILRLIIPNDAPETSIRFNFEVSKTLPGKEKEPLSDQVLDFQISRQGLIKAAMC